jgi:hypothetical protein
MTVLDVLLIATAALLVLALMAVAVMTTRPRGEKPAQPPAAPEPAPPMQLPRVPFVCPDCRVKSVSEAAPEAAEPAPTYWEC